MISYNSESWLYRVIQLTFITINHEQASPYQLPYYDILLLTEREIGAEIYCPRPSALTDPMEVNTEDNIFLN